MARRFIRGLTLVLTIAMLAIVSQPLLAQDGGDGGGGGGGGGGNAGGGGGSGGVEIDANSVLSSRTIFDDARALDMRKAKIAKASLNMELQKPTELRLISLNRLEAEVAKLLEAGQPIPDEMRYLAGMTRLTHVFYFPETKDIVIGGPAEGFFLNSQNRVVGTESGQATLQLQDLIVALRAFGPNGRKTSLISCSIDPTQEGLARMRQEYANVQRQIGGNINPGIAPEVTRRFQQALGMQVITVKGISPKTRMAHVLVDADYHMKLIGIGLEKPPVRITSFIDKASPRSVAKNSLQRWFFQPEYNCIRVNEDETAMQLVDGGVKLVGEDESVSNQGERSRTGKMNKASRTFCGSFTKMYDRLAERTPLFAELRNVMDMTIAAAYIQEMDYYGQSGWEMSTFGDESKIATEIYPQPKYVQPAINAVWKGRYFMTPIGGGVSIQARQALASDKMKVDEDGFVQSAKDSVSLDNLKDGQWWWD